MNIQLQANCTVDGCVEPTTVDHAEFFSLYEGEPGSYEWMADFASLEPAQIAGRVLARTAGHHYIENLLEDEKNE